MTEKFVWVLCLGIVGVVVVAVAAPALPTAVSVVDDEGIEPAELDEEDEELLEEAVGEQPSGGEGGSLPAEWIFLGAGVFGVLILARVALANPAKSVLALAVGGIGLVAVLGWLAVGGWETSSSPTESVPNVFPLVVAALLLALGVGAGVVALSRDETATPSLESTTERGADDPESLEHASAAESEPLEDVPVDNDVYRAWQAVTESVDKHDDETATPGDVREAAIAHGCDADTVDELTRLFEDSRYGGREPDPDRERRARDLQRELIQTGDDGDA